MIDKTFREAYKQSHDSKYLCRLFRIDSDDGSIRMSIEVMTYSKRLVFYHLPEEYWLGTTELLDWDAEQNILFFTTNNQTKAFIYDVTFLTLVSCDIKLRNPKDYLWWDEKNKCWMIKSFVLSVKQNDDAEDNPMTRQYTPGDYYETIPALKLPYPSEEEPAHKIISTPKSYYKLVLTKLDKRHPVEPTMWQMGIIDMRNYTWVVERLPYIVKGEESIIFNRGNMVECYGFDKNMNNLILFRFELKSIEEKNKVILYINDFYPHHPAFVTLDPEYSCWRAVINGEMVCPRPFYFDNMYSEGRDIEGSPIPLEVLVALSENDKSDGRTKEYIESLKAEKKEIPKEESIQNNTPAEAISEQTSTSNSQTAERAVPLGTVKRINFGFLTSNWFIAQTTIFLLGAIIYLIAFKLEGTLSPSTTTILYAIIAILFVLDAFIIIQRSTSSNLPHNFVLPYHQKLIMCMVSPIIVYAIILMYILGFFNHLTTGTTTFILAITLCSSSALFFYGRKLQIEAINNQQHNIGCWMHWASIVTGMLALFSFIATIIALFYNPVVAMVLRSTPTFLC